MKRIKVTAEQIKEYAEELYLTPNEQGKHAYPQRKISQEISQRFHKDISYRTIGNWAKQYRWDKLWETGQVKGILQSVIKVDGVTNQEQIIVSIS